MPWPFTRKKGKAQPMPNAKNISGAYSAFNANNFTRKALEGMANIQNQANLNNYVKTRKASLEFLTRNPRYKKTAKRALKDIEDAYEISRKFRENLANITGAPPARRGSVNNNNLLGLNKLPPAAPIDSRVFNYQPYGPQVEINEYEGIENPWKNVVVAAKPNNSAKPNGSKSLPMAKTYKNNPFRNGRKKGKKNNNDNVNPFKIRGKTGNPFKNTEGYEKGIEPNTSSTGNPFGASRRRPWWKRLFRK